MVVGTAQGTAPIAETYSIVKEHLKLTPRTGSLYFDMPLTETGIVRSLPRYSAFNHTTRGPLGSDSSREHQGTSIY